MRKFLLVMTLLFSRLFAGAQDNCTNAVSLCANNQISRSTAGATPGAGDPALSCGDNTITNNVWFTVEGIANGNCTVTVSGINNNPGLEMEIYTGSCGALVTTGNCTTGSSGTGGTMTLSFATTAGTIYYIMVDGASGNQESFDIVATTSNSAIVARPDANFNTNPANGCAPLNVLLENTSILQGGSNITYEWRIDNGAYVPGTGADTNVVFTVVGNHTVTLRVCNTECGCKTVSQDVTVQNLYPSITFLPNPACIGSTIQFDGDAEVLPDPPYTDPNVTTWSWNFGDPGSGANNTATGQSVTHTFNGPGTSYVVTLIADGTCGPDTTTQTINLNPQPVVTTGGPVIICEGENATLTAVTSGGTLPITYNWIGPGTYSCTNCTTTVVSGLNPGTNTITIEVEDSRGCTADTTVDVEVNERPVADAGIDQQICRYSNVTLNGSATNGTPPYSYLWVPPTGLSNPTLPNPTTVISSLQTYCLIVTDSLGCVSDTACVEYDIFQPPSITPLTTNLCATAPDLENDFTVTGAGTGSTYAWGRSTNYSLITDAASDSSTITVTFPPGIAATYSFTAIVTDGVTGCLDTVTTTFTVTAGLNMTLTAPTDVCEGNPAVLSASGATTYAWTADPPFSFTDSTLASQTITPVQTAVYTVTGTTGTCSQVLTQQVNVNVKPDAAADPIPPFCGCDSVQLIGSSTFPSVTYQWTTTGGFAITDPTNAQTSGFACANDIFTLRVTDPSTGCFMDTSLTTSSLPRPDATALVNPNLICPGVPTLITLDGTGSDTNAGTSYFWTCSDTSITITDPFSLITTATVSNSVIFSLTVTDQFGCDSTISDTVFIQPPPVINTATPFLCTTDPSLLATLNITGASPGSTYNWTTVPGCVTPPNPSGGNQTFDFGTCGAGAYAFTVEVTDAVTGCINTVNQTINVVSGVTLTTTPNTGVCEGTTVLLAASGANSYAWSNGATTDTITLTGLTAASSPYNFTVTGTIGSCTATSTITVTIHPLPQTSTISGPATACENETGINYSVNPPTGNYTWLVTGGTLQAGQGSNTITVDWGTNGSGIVTVVDTNTFGCPGTPQTLNVTINARPTVAPAITGPATICETTVSTYNVFATPGSTFNWSVAGGTIIGSSQGPTITVQWPASGAGVVTAVETNTAGCEGPDGTYNVSINPRPAPPVLTGPQQACQGTTEIYSTPYNPGSVYNWQTTGGSISSVSTNTDSATISWPNAGNWQVTVFETNSFSCSSDTIPVNVTVNAQPTADVVTDSTALCQNNSINLIGSAPIGTISWSTSGTGTFNDPTIASPSYAAGSSDTGYVSLLMVVSATGCPNDTDGVVLYVSPAPVLTITSTQSTICYGSNDTLRATGGETYIWTPGGFSDSTIVVSPTVTTTYTVAAANSFGCVTVDSTTVTVIPPGIPDPGFDQVACTGDTVQLTGSQQNAGGLLWSTSGDGIFIPSATDPNAQYIPGTNDTISNATRIYLTTTGACLNLRDSIELNILDEPLVNAGNDTLLAAGPNSGATIPLNPVVANVTSILWTTSGSGTFSPSDTSLNATYTPSSQDYQNDTVILVLNGFGGCYPAIDTIVVELAAFIIPNVFTPYPASPGKNDYFVINNLPDNCPLKIWDRWGHLVFESDNYKNNWDAANLNADTYYYVITARGKDYKGWISVLRDE